MQIQIKERLKEAITQMNGTLVMRQDLREIASDRQLSRALKALIEEGVLVRFGHGLYAKARRSSISGKPVPQTGPSELAVEFLKKQGIPIRLGEAQEAYASGKTPDVPVHIAFNTGKYKVTRKFMLGRVRVRFENDFNSYANDKKALRTKRTE